MRLRTAICFLFFAAFLMVSAYADNDTYYIFQVKQKIEDEQILAEVEPVYEEAGLYRTNNFTLIRAFEENGDLIDYTVDADVNLFGLQEDIEALRGENWCSAMLGADYANSQELSGDGTRIALIDSGIRPDYSELTGSAVVQGINYLASPDSEDRSDTTDAVGHGTFVASIVTSDAIGLAPRAELVPFKCFDSSTSSVSYIVSAIYAAADDYLCDVINLSLGTKTDISFLHTAVSYAHEKGVIIVAASGNLAAGRVSTGNDALYYPAAYDEVISVGAVDAKKQIAPFSVQNQAVTLVAPGKGVSGLSHQVKQYIDGEGTSYASPYVAAAAALALEADAALSPDQFLVVLQTSSEDLGEDGRDNTYGYGILNLGLLLAELQNNSESLILSLYDDKACVSAYQQELEKVCRLLVAFYDEGGRFSDAAWIGDNIGGCILNNYVLPGNLGSISVFVVDRDTFAPQTGVRRN